MLTPKESSSPQEVLPLLAFPKFLLCVGEPVFQKVMKDCAWITPSPQQSLWALLLEKVTTISSLKFTSRHYHTTGQTHEELGCSAVRNWKVKMCHQKVSAILP